MSAPLPTAETLPVGHIFSLYWRACPPQQGTYARQYKEKMCPDSCISMVGGRKSNDPDSKDCIQAKPVIASEAKNVIASEAKNVIASEAKNVIASEAKNVIASEAKNVIASEAKQLPLPVLLPEPVYLQFQVQQTFAAKTIGISLIHERTLLFADGYAKTLALRDVARLAGKYIPATRALTGFVVTHVHVVERNV